MLCYTAQPHINWECANFSTGVGQTCKIPFEAKSESANIRFAQEHFYGPAAQHLMDNVLKVSFTYGIHETV